MLVVVQDEEELSGPERQLVRWLKGWAIGSKHEFGGVAVANCRIPHPTMGYRQVDMIIWTPHVCVIVEVKGFKSPQSGTVEISLNGEWTIDGEPAALYVSKADSNPVGQIETNVYAAKNHFRVSDISPDWIHGLVLLFPPSGKKLLLKTSDSSRQQKDDDTVNLRDGIDVAVGEPKPLRRYLFRRRSEQRHTPLWSAQAVAMAFESLQMTAMTPSLEAMVAEGFPKQIEHPYRHRPRLPAAAPSPSTTTISTQAAPIPNAQGTAPSAIPAPAAQLTSAANTPPAPPSPAGPSMLVRSRPTPTYTNRNTHRTPSLNWAPPPRPTRRPRRKFRLPRRLLKLALAILIAVVTVKLASSLLSDRFPETQRFQSPSGNLSCEATGETSKAPARVTCSAATYFYSPPPSPPDCPAGEFGHAIALTRTVGANFTCTPGPEKTTSRVLPYDSTTTLDSITCASSTEGIVCTDDTGHGFHIERDSYNLW